MSNAFLENLVGFEADGVFVTLCFQVFVKVRLFDVSALGTD